ncbi:MAG: AMP-binding protein [Bacteroidales bacterium]|nr:AMP-binding protein [Bacteroidales bacterium]
MIEHFLPQVDFSSYEDFLAHFKVNVPDNFNFAYDVVDVYAEQQPEKEAILWSNDKGDVRHLTYREFKEETDRCASFLQSIGVERGDRVMLILKRRLEWWITMVALHKIGAVAIPATHMLTSKDITYRCYMAGISCIVACGDPAVLENVQKARRFCKMLNSCISIGPSVPNGWYDYHLGLREAEPFVRPERNRVTDNFLLYFTSGTTGEPKMVMHDYSYPLAHIITAKYWHNVHEGSLHMTLADTGWGKAVWGKFYGQMIAGATVFVYDYEGRFEPCDLLKVLQDFHITSFCAPPTIYRFLIREDISAYDLSALEYCTTAGEALNPNVFEEWKQKTGITIYESYGQTETTLVVGTYPWVKPRPGAMGVRNPQYHIDVLNEEGRPVKPMEHGELVIHVDGAKPLGLFKCYYRNDEMTEKRIMNNVYYTGDVVYRDEDGYLWFVSRADDVIKTSGYRVGPFEVESALMTHAAVVECAITAVPDEIRGQIVKATVVLSEPYRNRIKDNEEAVQSLVRVLQEHVKKETAPYKYPRIIEFVDELPKTISGKIRRVEIREKSAAQG